MSLIILKLYYTAIEVSSTVVICVFTKVIRVHCDFKKNVMFKFE